MCRILSQGKHFYKSNPDDVSQYCTGCLWCRQFVRIILVLVLSLYADVALYSDGISYGQHFVSYEYELTGYKKCMERDAPDHADLLYYFLCYKNKFYWLIMPLSEVPLDNGFLIFHSGLCPILKKRRHRIPASRNGMSCHREWFLLSDTGVLFHNHIPDIA